MLCKKCGYYAPVEAIICPQCGETLREGAADEYGAEAIRQGKRAREAVKNRPAQLQEEFRRRRRTGASHATVPLPPVRDTREELPEYFDPMVDDLGGVGEDRSEEQAAGIERRNTPVYSDDAIRQAQAAAYAARHAPGHRPQRLVNWFKVALVTILLTVLVAGGGFLMLTRTEPGHILMARMGQKTTSTALWKVGEELLDQGNIADAILSFEKAKAQDAEEDIVDVEGLLLLGNAYEADGRVEDAAALYEEIYTETPSRVEAYRNHIRILLASEEEGSNAQAAELMKTAYEKTGEVSFYNQWLDFVPAPPEVNLTAGYYEDKKKDVRVTSFQGFNVYYTFDENAKLPEGGILFSEPIFLDEGIHTLRAVAVNGELVSDELRAVYKIIMPSPQKPRCNLAPNAYKTRQRVKLKPGEENENDDDIVIYYTVDGSNPPVDSPVYDGEPIWLPGGRVYLKAVAVNKYNKISNMMTVEYKINIPEPLRGYNYETDSPKDFTLYVTTMMEFQQMYGEGTLIGEVTLENIDTECRRYDYPWGYAVMSRTTKGWVLAEVYLTQNGTIAAPRGTKIGDEESFVVGKFRDMGQVASPSGNRGLYSGKDGTGKIWLQDDGTKIIRYRCYSSDGSHWWQLDYYVSKAGIVTAIDMLYEP